MVVALVCHQKAEAQTTVFTYLDIPDFDPDTAYQLHEWILPESIEVFADGEPIPREHWIYEPDSYQWRIRRDHIEEYRSAGQLRIEYQAYPLAIRRTFVNREAIEVGDDFFINENDSSRAAIAQQGQVIFDNSNLQQRGSLSRGIIVGTNQDFALESGLQFELNGQLTDDVSINASLTDKSIPIQPDGTTQNLREFDRVFIQLKSQNTRVEMGDVDVSFEQSTFAKLNRRLQGAAGYSNTDYGDYSAALSVVRGTYKSVSFQGQDGVQGPYRLTGRENDEFVIVLAGTERVYINGNEVTRGEEYEYIIDYGLGEIYFTNNLLIKDETRIVVEYEYIDQNFNSTLIAAEAKDDFFDGKLSIGASVIRQADGDELLSQRALDQDDINVLKGIGDDLDAAVVSGERVADDEDDNNVRYAKVDTTLNGQVYSIYKNIPGSGQSLYIVSFTKVGEGAGSYERVSGSVNGLLYEWVGPGLGKYEAFRKLPAPKEQHMIALNSALALSDKIQVFGEFATSGYDRNRFSDLDDNDNNDISYLSGIRLNSLETSIGDLSANVSRRYTGANFRFFERTKEVEFDRKWNINRVSDSEESLNEASLVYDITPNTKAEAEFGLINRDDFEGSRYGMNIVSNEQGIPGLNYMGDYVDTKDEISQQSGNWLRQKGSVSKNLGFSITPYVGFEHENRIQRDLVSDSLRNASFSFYELGPGVRFGRSVFNVDASVYYRSEDRVLGNELEKESTAIEQRLKVNYQPSNYFNTKNEIAIRNKEFISEFRQAGNNNRNGLLLRSVTDYSTSSEFINGQVLYEANTERRALLQEAYLEVGPELGQYVWIDDNNDGVQQIDEFYPELSPNEGTYVLQYLPSDELFNVIDLRTRFRNEIRPLVSLSDEAGVSGLFSGLTLRSRIDISENSTTDELSDVYLLKLNTFRNDSTTIQGRLFWEQEFDLFPEVQKADVLFGYNQGRSLNKRSSESQTLYNDLYYINSSYRINGMTRIFTDLSLGQNSTKSDRLSSRNFEISSFTITPGVDAVINRSWQSTLSFSYANKEDKFPGTPVKADIIKVINSHRAFLWKKIQVNGRLELRNAKVEGASSTLGTYELTEGTGLGTNLVWSLSGSYRMSDLVRISFNYDGRTVKNRQDIQTIKLVVSAVF